GAERTHHGNKGSAVQLEPWPAARFGTSDQRAQEKLTTDMTTTAFLTDSTLCIGCKACEVACKEWNGVSADGYAWQGLSYDNTAVLGHSTWRHVEFVEGNP